MPYWKQAGAILGLLLSLEPLGPALAASFDCAKAKTPDERAICRDRSLNDQDVRLGVLFETTSHFLAMGSRDAARERQSAWLVERRRCRADRACLRRAYSSRIAELQVILDKAYALGPL